MEYDKKEEKHLCQKRKEKCHGMNKGKRRGKKDKIKNKNLINKTKQTKNVMPLKKPPSFVLFICTCIKSALFLL